MYVYVFIDFEIKIFNLKIKISYCIYYKLIKYFWISRKMY